MVVGMIVMSVVLGFFNSVSQDMEQWDAPKALVSEGKIDPLEAKVTHKNFDKRKYWKGAGSSRELEVDLDFWVTLEVATIGSMTRGVTKKTYESISEGQSPSMENM